MSRNAVPSRTASQSRIHRQAVLTLALVAAAAVPRAVLAQADFSAQATPNPVTLTASGNSVAVTVSTTAIGGFAEPIIYSFTGFPAGIATGGAQTVSPPYPPAAFTFSASAGVAPGVYTGMLTGTSPSLTRTFPFTVNVTAPPEFTLALTPMAITLEPTQTRTVTVSVMSTNLSGNVQVMATPPPGITVQPSTFSVAPNGQAQVNVSASTTAATGLTSVGFSGTAAGVSGSRTVSLSVTVVPPPPEIVSVNPPSVATGTSDNLLRITGRNFQPNALITSPSPGVQVVSARVLSSTTAEVIVSVRPDATPGRVELDLQNPDGGMAAGGARLLVYPARSLSAPLAVTSAVIVAPRQWEILAPGDQLRARALLATAGVGTITGTWSIDGAPFDRFTRVVSGGLPVEVVSAIPIPSSFTGEHRLELLIEDPAGLPLQHVSFIQAVERRSALQLLAPVSGSELDAPAVGIRWTLVPGASGYEVELESVNGVDDEQPRESRRHRLTDTEWRPGALIREMGTGLKRVRVRAIFPGEVPGEPTPWRSFTIVSLNGSAGLPRDVRQSRLMLAAADGLPFPLSWQQDNSRPPNQIEITVNSTTANTWADLADPPPTTRLQLSKQFDLRGSGLRYQATADVSGVRDLDTPWNGRAENANWLAEIGLGGPRFEQQTRIGFAPPSFFDQSEFLSVFTSGGALQGSIHSPAGRVGYYHSARLGGVPGLSDTEPKVEAAAYEAKNESGRLLFRTMLLRVTEPDADGFATGNRGSAVGVLGAMNLGPRLQLLAEVARGEITPGADSFEEERDGEALRLSLQGTSGTFGYSVAFGRTNEGFVNPANPGFTPGGISGRTTAQLGLQKRLGKALWSGSHSWTRGGIALFAGDPKTTENGTRMSLTVPVTQRLSFALGGNVIAQRGDGHDELGLPGTDRTQEGADLSVTERFGRFALTQGWTWQRLTDDVQPLVNQSVSGLSMTGTGALTSFLSLSANVSDTRSRPIPELGTTSRLMLSLQPSLLLSRFALQLVPRTSYSRTRNDVQESDFRTAMHQAIARFQPGWLGSLIVLEVSSDWKRNWSALVAERPPFVRSTVATLSLNWQADRQWTGAAR